MKNRMPEKTAAPDGHTSSDVNPEATPHSANVIKILRWSFNKVVFVTHINIFLYSTCFWIQTGTLPVGTKKIVD